MQLIKTLLISAVAAICIPTTMFAQDKAPYDGSWEALQKMPVPAWFDDGKIGIFIHWGPYSTCLLYTSPSPRDLSTSRMPSSA